MSGSRLTTTPHEAGIRINPEDWHSGETSRQSYVSPWFCTTIKHAELDRYQGTLTPSLVDRVAAALARYVGATEPETSPS